ncbi:hypothetical protein [Halococcus sp. PRR34]|uniref:hypothetical protein n=1 Tax=Halococcus sp. PRR34 TaxID=3020830 RepID=UPI00236304D9|nr:hypothetical protein [Halococcus sp. PRR34]
MPRGLPADPLEPRDFGWKHRRICPNAVGRRDHPPPSFTLRTQPLPETTGNRERGNHRPIERDGLAVLKPDHRLSRVEMDVAGVALLVVDLPLYPGFMRRETGLDGDANRGPGVNVFVLGAEHPSYDLL